MITIIDTDAMLALINPTDALHKKAKALLGQLYAQNAHLFILPTTLSEFSLLSVSRFGLAKTKDVVRVWTEGVSQELLEIDDALTQAAVKLFFYQTSKKESMFDCFVMAAAQKYRADCIFSFDRGYQKTKNGLKLASDLL